MAMAVGIVVGAFAGFYGGVVGAVLMRLVDAMLCFPTIFLLLALAALIEPGFITTTVLIAATAWMWVARVVEAQVRSLREREFAVAALAFGSSNLRIMFRELVPNAIAPIVVAATLNVAKAILLESYLSYLGYGIQPPAASLGNMLNNAQIYLTSAPWLAIAPGLRHHACGDELQLPRRRPARRARSADEHPMICKLATSRAVSIELNIWSVPCPRRSPA
ncbi:ABC-type dipeptide/oligopeptide/nickel transport system permease subunit [Bradyrhizobium sp. GM22.5]